MKEVFSIGEFEYFLYKEKGNGVEVMFSKF